MAASLDVRQLSPEFHKSMLAGLAANEGHLLSDFVKWATGDVYGQDMRATGGKFLRWKWKDGGPPQIHIAGAYESIQEAFASGTVKPSPEAMKDFGNRIYMSGVTV